ncbi:unnamed protein product [Acanthoscelides obtectus]|uniref:Uncharacterized protein n=1 Tax=Acanthoscelides obtectus TaxID=200917 RepID=A0A9P0K943_ACAOB|nr:unnamed protein product [Acanthoscelides obtectus]CAK1662350.1 hypothetical protein AOBTE_LOCUS23100 [Acanthoscelides obtectus]
MVIRNAAAQKLNLQDMTANRTRVLEHETTSSSTTQEGLDFATPSSKTKRQKKSAQIDEAYRFLTEAKEKLTKQDRFSYFGEVIACKLSSLTHVYKLKPSLTKFYLKWKCKV